MSVPSTFSSKTAFGLLATIPHHHRLHRRRLMNPRRRFLNWTREVKRNSVYFFLLPSAFNSAAPSRDQSMPRPSPLDGIFDVRGFFIYLRQFQNVQFCSRSRKAKILTTGIHGVFRGLKFEPDADIGQKGTF